MKVRKLTPYLLMLPGIGLLAFVIIYPLVFSIWVSLHRWVLARPGSFPFIGLDNYVFFIWKDPLFIKVLTNTFMMLGVCLSVEFVIALSLALLLNRRDIKGTAIFRVGFTIPTVTMAVVAGIAWRYMLWPNYGVFNHLTSLVGLPEQLWLASTRWAKFVAMGVIIWQATPFMLLIFYAGLVSLPQDLFDAANLDGASSWQTLRYLTLPLLQPVILVAVTIRMMDLIRIFDIVYVVTGGGPVRSSEVLTLYNWRMGLASFQMGRANALAIITVAIIMVITIVYLRIMGKEFLEREK